MYFIDSIFNKDKAKIKFFVEDLIFLICFNKTLSDVLQ